MAGACPGVREVSILHVSLTFVIPPCLADTNIDHISRHLSTNKVHRRGKIGLPRLKRYIYAFQTLSTITLIHRVGEARESSTGLVSERRLARLWNEAKDLAISQLRRSSAGGPKMLRVVTVSGGDELVEEEIVV